MEGSSSSTSKSGMVVVANERKPGGGIRIGNPFTLKVGQVFTGFGIGCGVGIGVGRPINLGAVPVLNQVMGATRGATDAFSGVTRHVTDSLRKVGAKNIEAGIGCGVGFGHGFGVGLALKPGVLHQIQFFAVQTMTKMMTKFGIAPNLPILQGAIPSSLQSGIGNTNDSSRQNSVGNNMQMATKPPDYTSQGLPRHGNKGTDSTYENFTSTSSTVDTPFGSRTEKVLSSFLQSSVLKGEESDLNVVAGSLRSENKILQMVLKHQQVIDELMEENEKLRHVLVEDLKVAPSKLKATYSRKNISPCSDCFDCRRKQRKNRSTSDRFTERGVKQGPGDYSAHFFKSAWEIVSQGVIEAISDDPEQEGAALDVRSAAKERRRRIARRRLARERNVLYYIGQPG